MSEDREFRDLVIAAEVDECSTLTEVYWKTLALSKKKAWLAPINFYKWPWIYLGSDEYWRRTLVIGPFVIALWITTEGTLIRKKLDEKLNTMYSDDNVL